jgi:hypothetical protein
MVWVHIKISDPGPSTPDSQTLEWKSSFNLYAKKLGHAPVHAIDANKMSIGLKNVLLHAQHAQTPLVRLERYNRFWPLGTYTAYRRGDKVRVEEGRNGKEE